MGVRGRLNRRGRNGLRLRERCGRWAPEVSDSVGNAHAFPKSNDADLSFEEIDVEFEEDISSDFLLCRTKNIISDRSFIST